MDKNKNFSHLDKKGHITMVDVGEKATTKRYAKALGIIQVSKNTLEKLSQGEIKKGEVLTTAKLAGILGAKKTSDLIPLCHNIFIDKVKIDCKLDDINNTIKVYASCFCHSKTGIEMESLTACSVALLTIYDMIKALDTWAFISYIGLEEKDGGKQGFIARKSNNI